MNTHSNNSETLLETIYSRTSVRSYSSNPVEEEKITAILKAAMSAPSAMNKQPWTFIVIDDPSLLKDLGSKLPNAKMTSSAPLAIAVCADMSKTLEGVSAEYWIQDAAAATENILLAAHALGLGAVWTGAHPKTERKEILRDALQLPKNIEPFCLIPIGYPAEAPKPKDKWNEENIHRNAWGK